MNKRITRISILLAFLCIGILLTLYLGHNTDVFAEKVIELVCSENKVSWSFKDNRELKGGYYVLYRNGVEVYKGDEQEYINPDFEDIEGPESVGKVNINYERDKITLVWDVPLDQGTDNVFKVYYVNKFGIKRFSSNEAIYNYSSGISEYILNIRKKAYSTTNNRIEIDRENLNIGVLDVSVVAIDNKGNESIPKDLGSIRHYNLDVYESSGRNNRIEIINPDKKQEYTYIIHIDNKEKIQFNGDSIDYKDIFKDIKPPDMPKVKHQLIVDENSIYDNNISFTWDLVEVDNTSYSCYIEGIGKTYGNKIFSKEFVLTPMLKGFYINVNKDESYRITDQDIFLNRDEYMVHIDVSGEFGKKFDPGNGIIGIDMEEDSETYYFHIAAVDTFSNISETVSYKFVVVSNERFKELDSFFIEDDYVARKRYSLEKRCLSMLPDNIINFIEKHKVKMHFTDENLNDVYYRLYGEKPKVQFVGLYIGSQNPSKILISNEAKRSIVLHEVGHAVDHIGSNYRWFSSNKDFIDIYKKEKDILYSNYEYPRTEPKEYFAEAFSDYFMDPLTVKEKAPLTYEYMDKLVKSIK